MKNKTKIKAWNYCSVSTIKIGELIDTVIIPQSWNSQHEVSIFRL